MTLVGVVDADLGLANGDPRAAERAFQFAEQSGHGPRGANGGARASVSFRLINLTIRDAGYRQRQWFALRPRIEERERNLPPFGAACGAISTSQPAPTLKIMRARFAAMRPRRVKFPCTGPAEAPLAGAAPSVPHSLDAPRDKRAIFGIYPRAFWRLLQGVRCLIRCRWIDPAKFRHVAGED